METSKVTKEPIQQEVVVGLCKASVDQNVWVDRRSQRIVGERVGYITQRLEGVASSDAVRARVHPDDVLETSGRDLNIVTGISPTAQSAHFVIVEHCRVFCVERIWQVIFQNAENWKGW